MHFALTRFSNYISLPGHKLMVTEEHLCQCSDCCSDIKHRFMKHLAGF